MLAGGLHWHPGARPAGSQPATVTDLLCPAIRDDPSHPSSGEPAAALLARSLAPDTDPSGRPPADRWRIARRPTCGRLPPLSLQGWASPAGGSPLPLQLWGPQRGSAVL